jgi:phage/plasmid-like protein (TIGR03299 family)
VDAGFRDGDKILVNTDRGLPWWFGSNVRGTGTMVGRQGFATVEEAVRDGGLDFDVALRPLLTMGLKGRLTKIDTHFAVVRDDTGAALGVVGRKYRPIQYREGLGEFGRAILATDEAAVDTAGTMYGGRIGCIWFELNDLPVRVAGEKAEGEIHTYLGISSSHDGSSALTATITPVRWVCKNTLNFSRLHARATFKVRHSGSVESKVAEARRVLGITHDYMAEFAELAERLVHVKVADDIVKGIMEEVWPVKEDLSGGWAERHPSVLATENYFASSNLDPIRGTAWAVLNAAVEYVDHEAPYRGRLNELSDVKSSAVLWGRGARAKDRALVAVKAYAGIK